MEPVHITYTYQISDEKDLEDFLAELKNELGGERSPYSSSKGAIDLVAFLGIVATFVIVPTLQSAVQKYLEGFFNLDDLNNTGEDHRKQVFQWFQDVESQVSSVIRTIQAKLSRINKVFIFQQKEEALVLEIPTKFGKIYIVLNHKGTSKNRRKCLTRPGSELESEYSITAR
jgi:hypothetical protein